MIFRCSNPKLSDSTAQHSTAQHSTAQHSTKFFFDFRPALLISLPLLLAACGGGGTSTATNSAPVVPDVSGEVTEDTPRSITLPGTDADGNTLTYSVVTPPAHGTLSVSGDQATYTPATNYHGADRFTYKASDGVADSNTATVSITVTPVNDAPTANAGTDQTATEGETVNLSGSGVDIDSATLTYGWAQTGGSPVATLVTTNAAALAFTAPAVSVDTTLTFTLTVSDGSLTATDTVNVLVKDKPVVAPTPTGKLNDTGITLCGDSLTGKPLV